MILNIQVSFAFWWFIFWWFALSTHFHYTQNSLIQYMLHSFNLSLKAKIALPHVDLHVIWWLNLFQYVCARESPCQPLLWVYSHSWRCQWEPFAEIFVWQQVFARLKKHLQFASWKSIGSNICKLKKDWVPLFITASIPNLSNEQRPPIYEFW